MTPGSNPEWPSVFLKGLAETGVVKEACKAADVSREMAYRLRREDAVFAAAWDAALEDAADALESEARRRAKDGVDEPVIYQGELMGCWVMPDGSPAGRKRRGARFVPLTVKKYSDALLMQQLKAHRPEKYRETTRVIGSGKDGEILIARVGAGRSLDDL